MGSPDGTVMKRAVCTCASGKRGSSLPLPQLSSPGAPASPKGVERAGWLALPPRFGVSLSEALLRALLGLSPSPLVVLALVPAVSVLGIDRRTRVLRSEAVPRLKRLRLLQVCT